MSLLQVRDLATYYYLQSGVVKAVDGINLELKRGEALGLAGESGCGKSTTALSIMKLLPANGKIVMGKILLEDEDLAGKNEDQMRPVRWKKVSMIFQGAMNALNPAKTVGAQVAEPIIKHERATKREAWRIAFELFKLVGLDSSRLTQYPHEFSGGMRQRAMIAMSLACNPKLVLADEPTTALDVMVQSQILELIGSLRKRLGLSMILITHDLSVIAETCDKIVIMYAGKVAESGNATSIFGNPSHPYTQGLIGAFPSIESTERAMAFIPGTPPNLVNPPRGCRFHPRCPSAREICKTREPELTELEREHFVACYFAKDTCEKWLLGAEIWPKTHYWSSNT